nr:MAG TPA: hypothetical protein [Caudoviricetes sp.]DAS82683.1 MAG TPA: hypothetical protein [Caudoviricetes sp.]
MPSSTDYRIPVYFKSCTIPISLCIYRLCNFTSQSFR